MSETIRRRFRATFEIEVSLQTLDDALIATARERMHTDQAIPSPIEPDLDQTFLERDRALIQALMAHPSTLLAVFLRRAAESFEFIKPEDESLHRLQATIDDSTLVEQIRDHLSPDAYTFLKGASDDGAFYDNTTYFEEALQVRQVNFHLEPLDALALLSD